MNWRPAAEQHALQSQPRESCGLLVMVNGAEEYFACRNMATGADHFILDPLDYLAADVAGEIVGVVHSHPNAPATPSVADVMACNATCLTWHIVSLPDLTWERLEPKHWDN